MRTGSREAGYAMGLLPRAGAIVVVAIVYSATIYLIDQRTPEVVFGAIAACFTVIGTLVGTYFGIKAGLDGQDKLKQTLARIDYGPRERPQDGTERSEDRTKKGTQAEEGQRAARDLSELGKGAYAERRDWDGGSV